MKTGDTVRYLNAVGGGVITRFEGKDIIHVLEADGFETPVLIRDVVVVEPTNAYNFPTSKSTGSKELPTEAPTTKPAVVEKPVPQYTFNDAEETADGETLSIYLAFVPKKLTELQNTPMDCYIINDSNYYLDFIYLSGEEQMALRKKEHIEPQTKLLIDTVQKNELNALEFIRFQAVAYKPNKPFTPKPAIDVTLHINLPKFYKLHTFQENDFFDEKAFLLTIIEQDNLHLEIPIDPLTLTHAMHDKERTLITKRPRMKQDNAPLEIDLHIHQLVDSTAGISNADMLEVQLNKFHEIMRANIKNRGQKIVFIHGKGEGVLRQKIEKELKTKYHPCRYQDASFQQYGFGATQVTIH